MDFPDRTTLSGDAPDDVAHYSSWPEPGPGLGERAVDPDFSPLTHRTIDSPGSTDQASDVTFDAAFEVLDRQSEQLRTLRGKLESLSEYNDERDRTVRRLEQELGAARAESERDRRIAAGLRAKLASQDELLRSVRESVSELAVTLDAVGTPLNESRAA